MHDGWQPDLGTNSGYPESEALVLPLVCDWC